MEATEMYDQPPTPSENLVLPNPSLEIYESFGPRIADFGRGFRQREFVDARDDFEAPFHEAATDDLWELDARRYMIQRIITPESYEPLVKFLADYWDDFGLEELLKDKTIVVLTNHRAFSDIPVAAVALSDMRQHDPYAVQRNALVVGRMIPAMEVDMDGSGLYLPATPLLTQAGRQAQTVPGVGKDWSEAAQQQRKVWNIQGKEVLSNLLAEPGNIVFIAASGTHDQVKGDTLVMQHVNQETVKLLDHPEVIVVPLFFSCLSFDAEGLQAVDADYAMLPPRAIRNIEDMRQTMADFSVVGSRLLADEFPGGVTYIESWRERSSRVSHRIARSIGERVIRRISHDTDDDA